MELFSIRIQRTFQLVSTPIIERIIIIPIKKVVIFIHVADELFIISQMKYMTDIMIQTKTIENIINVSG